MWQDGPSEVHGGVPDSRSWSKSVMSWLPRASIHGMLGSNGPPGPCTFAPGNYFPPSTRTPPVLVLPICFTPADPQTVLPSHVTETPRSWHATCSDPGHLTDLPVARLPTLPKGGEAGVTEEQPSSGHHGGPTDSTVLKATAMTQGYRPVLFTPRGM